MYVTSLRGKQALTYISPRRFLKYESILIIKFSTVLQSIISGESSFHSFIILDEKENSPMLVLFLGLKSFKLWPLRLFCYRVKNSSESMCSNPFKILQTSRRSPRNLLVSRVVMQHNCNLSSYGIYLKAFYHSCCSVLNLLQCFDVLSKMRTPCLRTLVQVRSGQTFIKLQDYIFSFTCKSSMNHTQYLIASFNYFCTLSLYFIWAYCS